jgi:methylmalonyl-CoA mutase, N-terminal domain
MAGDERRVTDSGIELKPVYRPGDLDGWDPRTRLGEPGGSPYTRGIYASMYRGRLWTMRQYAGMATAEETNARFRYLLEHGQTGLSVAFDLPTQIGLDSDHPRAEGEVGKTGVAIDSIEDMHRLFEDIPLDEVSTSMTINATAPILLLLYELVAEERGIPADRIAGTVQNDLLKEYAARGTYIYPPGPSMRLITDLIAYCGERIPRWNTISISGYHMREAGATAAQEIAFTLANGIAYVQAALDAGLRIDDFAPRLSFFFACHMNFFEEVAKFRAARRIWGRVMTERFGS